MRDAQPLGLDALGLQQPDDLHHSFFRTGNHGRTRPIDRRHTHLSLTTGQQRQYVRLSRPHRHH
ncbi:hypothetical protein, partial [Streptomyces sp. 5-10]|uniref:hypothetical protein n=1 Tax=Streptomyces sp. 5-10 TaxID=878925 RepID=UPI00295F39EC